MAAGNSIKFLSFTVEDIEDNAHMLKLLKHIKPEWVLENLECEQFEGGLVNRMAAFYQRSDIRRDDAVVVRVFSDRLGDLNPRNTEFMAMQIAQAAGCFPTVHASFTNGVVYKYAKGRVLGFADLLKHEVINDITRKVYRLNHVDLGSLKLYDREGHPAKYDGGSGVFSRVKLMLNTMPKVAEDPDRDRRFQNFRQKFTDEMLLEEHEFVKQVHEDVQMPLLFSHGDLHPRNMILNEEKNEVMFVDFELTGFNYACYDLSYMLSARPFFDVLGWAHKSEPDISEAARLQYVKGYLTAMFESSAKEAEKISDLDIEFIGLQLKLGRLLVYHALTVVGLALVNLPGADLLNLIPVTREKYTSLKNSITDIKSRYVELRKKMTHTKA